MICGYRIYPAWFGDVDPLDITRDMAQRAALMMDRTVIEITKVGSGFDQRGGHYVDFDVTYSTTAIHKYEEVKQ